VVVFIFLAKGFIYLLTHCHQFVRQVFLASLGQSNDFGFPGIERLVMKFPFQ
jgi:hypothetical protein